MRECWLLLFARPLSVEQLFAKGAWCFSRRFGPKQPNIAHYEHLCLLYLLLYSGTVQTTEISFLVFFPYSSCVAP